MRRALRLAVERLEERDTPATLGMPWVDPQHLTLSFAPDGTPAGAAPSTLAQTLSGEIPTGDWRLEILRAFQTWASNANINIGLVADGGQALGVTGLVQGDSRFGDIRIGAVPLGPSLVASGTAFQPNGSTWSGDVLLNTAYTFTAGGQSPYDLFTVVLHESGHVFGLGDNTNPLSVMYQNYGGLRGGLTAQDLADLQSLYGARKPDAFDAKQANGSMAGATPLGPFSSAVTGDVTTLDDQDWYKFSVPDSLLSAGTPVYAQLRTSGMSLLVGSLTVYDGSGNVVGSAAATSPLSGDLSVQLPNAAPGGVYYVKVTNATQSVFGIGSYQLGLSTQAGTPSNRPSSPLLNVDNHRDDSLAAAIKLTGRNSSSGTRLDFSCQASISDPGDVDFYKVHSQAGPAGSTLEMIALVSASDLNGLAPRVDVYDAAGNPVAAQVIGNEKGFFSVQLTGALPDRDYYVKVSSLAPNSPHATGNYFLGVDFNATQTVDLKTFTGGTLTQANSQQTQALAVATPSAFHFALAADAGGATNVQVQMSIVDAKGNLVFRLVSYAGQPASTGVAYLAAGSYSIRYAAVSRDGSLPAAVSYTLKGTVLSDPIGPVLVGSTDTTTDTTTTTTTIPTPTPDYTWSDPSVLALSITYSWVDPYYYY